MFCSTKVGNWKNREEESALTFEVVEYACRVVNNSARSLREHRIAQRRAHRSPWVGPDAKLKASFLKPRRPTSHDPSPKTGRTHTLKPPEPAWLTKLRHPRRLNLHGKTNYLRTAPERSAAHRSPQARNGDGETLGGGRNGQGGAHFVNTTAYLMLTNAESPHDAGAGDVTVALYLQWATPKPQTLAAAHFVLNSG
jgi:hypothetical protein